MMAIWEARNTRGTVLGRFVSADVPVPRLGDTLSIIGFPSGTDGGWQVMGVHHVPMDRHVVVTCSPTAPRTAGYGEMAMEEEA